MLICNEHIGSVCILGAGFPGAQFSLDAHFLLLQAFAACICYQHHSHITLERVVWCVHSCMTTRYSCVTELLSDDCVQPSNFKTLGHRLVFSTNPFIPRHSRLSPPPRSQLPPHTDSLKHPNTPPQQHPHPRTYCRQHSSPILL